MSTSCSADESWWNPDNFHHFYLAHSVHVPNFDITQETPIEQVHTEDGKIFFQHGGQKWISSEKSIKWIQSPLSKSLMIGLAEMDHWHTSFSIRSHALHIDFVSFLCMGPQTAYREYRVFCDQKEVGRGGGFSGFLGGNFRRFRNWPLSVKVEGYLLHIHKPLQPWSGGFTKGEIFDINPFLFIKDNNFE